MNWCAACSACSACAGCSVGCVTCAGCGGCVITPTPDVEVAVTGVASGTVTAAAVGGVAGVAAW
ncbi:hypothetical protein [Halothermothrix orenii]|uniref:hypothetical protein n=1 Tax=Halothermothrix orenii TaxID=31909 RepID=UPI0003027214|nr:hypothetical protein [Halothermothrix orenii]